MLYDTTEGRRTKVVTAGVAQGSVLGPDIWNTDYDDILGLSGLPEGASLVGYADDIVLVITVKNLEEAQRKLDVAMRRILNWLREHSLQLATHKSEVVLLTRKRIHTIVPVRIVDALFDNKLSFYEYIRQASEKASKEAATLSWLMANVGRPKPSRRKLLMSVVHSILLYGAEV